MPASDIVLIITAVGVLIGTIVSAIVTLRRVDSRTGELSQDVQEVHKIVNSARTDMLAYQAKLVTALQRSGVHVPEDESIRPPKEN